MQPPRAGPARTSSDPPGCRPTPPSRAPSPSPTTAPTPALRGVRTLRRLSRIASCVVPAPCDREQRRGFFFVTLRLSLSVRPRSLSPPGVCAKESLSSALALSAYRMPRRRYSTGGDEESWSNSLQRVSGFVMSLTGIIVIVTIVI